MSSATIGSALKRGGGRKDAIVSITESSEGDNDAVIATHEADGSSESANDGLVVRQSTRAISESTAPDTSDSSKPFSSLSSSSSSAGSLSTEGGVTMTNIQSLLSALLGPVVSQLQSVIQQQIVQGQQLQQLQSLSATVSSLSASMSSVKEDMALMKEDMALIKECASSSNASLTASVSSMKEDVAIIMKQVLPLTLVGGGLRTTNVLSVLYGAHGTGKGIFGFLDCIDGNNLRLVCHEMRTAVAAFPWNDKVTCIYGSLCSWRTCFPNARAASLWRRRAPLLDADFRFFRGTHHLDVSCMTSFSDAALSQLSELKHLWISGCTQLTDTIFPHLVGLESLVMHNCTQAGITGAAFEPLRGSIQRIETFGCREVVKAAARAIAPRSMAEYLNLIANALPAGGSHVLEDGRRMNKRQLFLECLHVYPHCAVAFNNLGNLLTSSERVTLPDGRSVNQRELRLEAVKHEPRNENAYCNLACGMTADERIRLPDGRNVSQRELFSAALRLNPRCVAAYYHLADSMTADERVELPDGRHMSTRELCLECLRLDPRNVNTFGNLACMATSATERISLPDGRSMNQRELYLEALRIDPRLDWALEELASTMTAKEKVTLPDNRVMTKKQLMAFAATLA